MTGVSRPGIIAALVVLVAFALASILLVSGDAATERLGLFFALVGTVVAALLSALRSDQAKTQTDGTLTTVTAQSEAFRAELPAHVQTAVLEALDTSKRAEAQRQVPPS